MAWVSGQVNPGGGESGYDLLLTALRDFLTTNATLVSLSQNWVLEKEETISTYSISGIQSQPSYTGNFRDLYLRGPGLAQQDNIHVNIRAYESVPSSLFNWYIQGATAFDTNEAWENQPGNNIQDEGSCFFTLVNSLIDYWFIANGRRFIVVCKIEGDFYVSYNGLFLPYGLPSEYPYPMFVSGTTRGAAFNHAYSLNRNFYNTRYQGYQYANCRVPSTEWAQVGNSDYSGTAIPYVALWPWHKETPTNATYNLHGNRDGSYTLLPAVLFTGEDGESCLGDMQGVYYVPGTGQIDLSAEDTITIGSFDYLIVQNVALSDRSNYAALKLE
jgi:hypothetical protein